MNFKLAYEEVQINNSRTANMQAVLKKEVSKLLGMSAWYQRFILNYAEIAKSKTN